MRIIARLTILIAALCCIVTASAQTPRVYFKFDGNLTDSSGAGIITSVTPSTGWTPGYTSDRFGQASKALRFDSARSLQLISSAFPGDSNQALGLRLGAGGSPFTLSAWVSVTTLFSSANYNIVFGNIGTGPGTLHAGLFNDHAHFGFDGDDANGATTTLVQTSPLNTWYHIAYVWDGTTQKIYINGIPEVSRTATTALKASDVLLGNWGSATDPTNDLRGAIDDVAIYNTALSPSKIQALFNNVDPTNLPVTYSAPKLPGPLGGIDYWGVREIKGYPGINYNSLVNADRVIFKYSTAPNGTVAEYQAPVINHADPDAPGISGYFGSEANFGTNSLGVDDNSFVMLAKGSVRITAEDNYTFGFRGDEGSRLRIPGQTFISGTAIGAGNTANPVTQGDAIYYPGNTTDSATLGVVHLVPGDYAIEYTYWESTGGSSCEVFAARGAKTSVDSNFQLVGNTAAGGLPLVRDPDTVPRVTSFTASGATSFFTNNGVPATFTLAWQTNAVPTSVSIDQGIGAVALNGSMVLATPAQTTTYTITATAGADVNTRTATVYVNAAPVINSFIADPPSVVANASLTLYWSVDGATSLTLQPGNIDVTGQTNRTVVLPATTTYTLIATNQNGSTQQSITTVAGLPPVINSFSVVDAFPLYGAETQLNWNVTNAATLSIDQGIGTVSGATGSVSIAPIATTTYTLTAKNPFGISTATTSVNQPTPIGVTAAGFTARRVFAKSTTPIPFTNQGYLQSAINLIGTGPNTGQNELNEATQANYQTVNFADGVDGDFTAGNSAFPGNGSTNYAVLITATLVVNSPGQYTFGVNSSYGARLRIDGQDVIVDDSSHSPGDASGTVNLSKPTAQLELICYGVSGSVEVELSWIRPNQQWSLLSAITPATPAVRGQVLINEFMTSNSKTILDEDGDSSDWIEIWNSTPASINLLGYYLTDDPAIPNKWAFPSKTLAANGYLVVFASAKNRTNPVSFLHTNFVLSKNGGYLALNRDDGAGGYNVISSFNPYPSQSTDISYGSSDAEGYIGYMDVPTPGTPNAATVIDYVQPLSFSVARGRHNTSFNLGLTTFTPGTTIRYTTDGTLPSLNHGSVYFAPFPVSSTTVIRAAAFKTGWKPSKIETSTYLFINDIVNQTAANAVALGFPSTSVNGQVFRYGMTQTNVTAGGGTLLDLKNALAVVPSICMTTDIANLVNPTTGIYVNPGMHDLFWERPVSLEYINALGGSEFQINCGARIRGGYSRSTTNPKHAFHMYFRTNLYDGFLNYPIFGGSGASTFHQIDMRCEENYSWSFAGDPTHTALREEWGRVSQGAAGQPQSRTGYFHLYINGIYWGIYNWEERTEADFAATYLGGSKKNFDTVKSAGNTNSYLTEMTDGNFAAWQNLFNQSVALKNDTTTEASRTARYMQMRGLNVNGTSNATYPALLDVDNLIDYMLVTFYDGSFDAPLSTFLSNGSNNWFGIRDRTGIRGFVFFIHDNEHGLDTLQQSYNRVGPWGGTGSNNWGQGEYGTRETFNRSNPQYLHEMLVYSSEYRQRFMDRVQKQFFNNGALTTAAALSRLDALAVQMDPIIHAEAARWGSGSLHKGTWLTAKNVIYNCINNGGTPQSGQTAFAIQSRNSLVMTELQGYQDPVGTAKPLVATLAGPVFSGQFGGVVPNPYTFTITNPNASGTLYYTVDGTDPRAIGGAVAAGALTGASPITVTLIATSTVRARVYDNTLASPWSGLVSVDYIAGTPATSQNLIISKIHYNPQGSGNSTQFIELMNISAATVDLTGVHFSLGLVFTFPPGYLLQPGGRILIVRDMAGFQTAYPTVPAGQIVGVFPSGSLLSTTGERLQLLDAGNVIIRDFSYNIKSPWPESPNGHGPCLVLLHPMINPDPSFGANWRASSVVGGTPGADDALLYTAWATANGVSDAVGGLDDDGDGLSNFSEYLLGTNPKSPNGSPVTVATQAVKVGGVVSDYLTLTFKRAIGREDGLTTCEASNDLSGWQAAILVTAPVFNGDGTETVTYRHPNPKAGAAEQFLRPRFTRQ